MAQIPAAGRDPGVLILQSAEAVYPLTNNLYVTEDIEHSFAWADMLARYEQNLKGTLLHSDNVRLPAIPGAYWFQIGIYNRTTTPLWHLDLGTLTSGRFGVINRLSILHVGDTKALVDTASPTRYVTLTIPPGRTSTFLIRVEADSGLPISLPFQLLAASDTQAPMNFSLFFILAITLIGAVFFMTVALMGLQKGAAYYSGFYIAFGLFIIWQNQFSLNGFALSGEMLPLLLTLSLIMGYAGSVYFWDKGDDRYSLNRISIAALAGVSLICLFLYALTPLNSSWLKGILIYLPFILIFSGMVFIGSRAVRNKNSGNDVMLIGWFVLFSGFLTCMLALHGFLSVDIFAYQSLWIAILIQTFLSLAASLKRIRFEKIEQTLTLEKVKREEMAMARIRQSKEASDQSRLLRVLEREREIMAELRERENSRTEEMRLAKEAADMANRAKSAFLAVVSHEIRTPMTGVMGMVRLLLDSNLTKDQRDHAMTIQESGDAMLALLNDILDFERIEVGKMEMEKIAFDLPRLIQSIVTLMSGHAAQKGITLKSELGPNVPKQVVGDPTRIRQVLLNLTGNAIKFTPNGIVTIRVIAGDMDETKNANITFSVVDTGIGISDEAQKNLFTPFSQADSSISRKFGGSGLGLAISKGLINAMGSDILVASMENKGSKFSFTLSMKVAQAALPIQHVQEQTSKSVLPACSILLVEDNEINRKVIRGFLNYEPVNVTEVVSAEEVFETLNTKTFDVILMDIELDGMRGDDAAHHLRAQGLKTPIVGLTGNISNEDTKHYYAVGMNGVVAKPVDPDKLKNTILRVLEESRQEIIAVENAASRENSSEDPAFDQAVLQTLKDNLPSEQLEELVRGALDKAGEIIVELHGALEEQDLSKLSAKGHELKGMAGNFGMKEISRMAAEVEKQARHGSIDQNLDALIADMPKAKARADAALAEWMRA